MRKERDMPIRPTSGARAASPDKAVPCKATRDVRELLRAFLGTRGETAGWTPRAAPADVVDAAVRLRVLPHVHSTLKTAGVPSPWREEVERALAPIMRRHAAAAMALRRHAASALRCLAAEGVPVIPFKGPFLSADVYGDPLFRPGADVDLLLTGGRADVARACAALREIGYVEPDVAPAVREYRRTVKGQFDLVGERMPPLDLHYALYDDLPAGAPADAAARAVVAPGIGADAVVDSKEPRRLRFAFVDLLMVLAVHYWRHPGLGGVLPLVDLAMVARDGRAFPDGWLDVVRSWRMSLYVAAGLEAVRHEFGVSPPGDAAELVRATLPWRFRALCERIGRDGPAGLPFGLVQRFHRLGLPWRERLRALGRYAWPHPGKLAEEAKDGRAPRGRPARLAAVGRRLLRAIRLR